MFDTYQDLALRTEKPLATPLARLKHAGLGLITETGEIVTEVKRHVIYGKPMDDARRAHIGEEIGDVCWYLAIAADVFSAPFFLETFKSLRPRVFAAYDFEALSLELAAQVGDFCGSPGNGAEQQLIYVAQTLLDIATGVGLSMEDILEQNIAKLRERFPDAYSNEAAEARADKGGLDARNS